MLAEVLLQPGSLYEPPQVERWRKLPGEIASLVTDPAAVSTAGPSLLVTLNLYVPGAAGEELAVVIRPRRGRYLASRTNAWEDPLEHFAASAHLYLPEDAYAEEIRIALPYAAFPEGSGGSIDLEVAVHRGDGELVALSTYGSELPEDVARSGDFLTVMAHALCAIAECDGDTPIDLIVSLLVDRFGLDDMGASATFEVVSAAVQIGHTPESLAEALSWGLTDAEHPRMIDLTYAVAQRRGLISGDAQAFLDALFAACGVHDPHRVYDDPVGDAFAVLEIDRTDDLDAVEAAWKKQVRDYHPDRVAHLAHGFVRFATEQSARINAAYDLLRQHLEPDTDQ
jgi:DnaJ like chaperone protein